jgi:hypothetical protein
MRLSSARRDSGARRKADGLEGIVARAIRIRCVAAAVPLLVSTTAEAAVISGFFNDSGNSALVWRDLGLPSFANDAEIAQNVAVFELTVTTAGTFTFTSAGFAAGGAEPYFSIFSGNGNAATFLDSNFLDPSIDFSLTHALAVGTYVLAVGVWENLSFAENLGTGSLGDGFTGLGDPTRLGSSYYEIEFLSADGAGAITRSGGDVVSPPTIPEPGTLLLLCVGLPGLAAAACRRRR